MAQPRQIPITRPYFTADDLRSVQMPLESGWVVQGPFVATFEDAIKKFTGAKYAVATSSCTTALHLGLIALGIKRGDHVIVPSFTWVSSANAIEYVGARPVFCDIDPKTFNIDVNQVNGILKKDKARKIKAIMPVHLFGLCADMKSISSLAHKYHLKVIEDAACALGGFIGKKHAGTFGDVGCFSFHPRKIITTGEGGMLVTNNKIIADLCRRLRDHGAKVTDFKRHTGNPTLPQFDELGFNYRLTDIQAALGVSQMKTLKKQLARRSKLAALYNTLLKHHKAVSQPYTPMNFIHGLQAYVVRAATPKLRMQMMHELQKSGISTRPGTHAVHCLGYYKKKYGFDSRNYYQSFLAQETTLALPLFHRLADSDVKKICAVLTKMY